MTRLTPERMDRLARAAQVLSARGVLVPSLEGKLLRPAVALSLVPPDRLEALDDGFWAGALAIQMVHEASLLHDDILDDAETRRGEATVVARRGIGPALVLGDQYLTGSYRAAAAEGSPLFLDRFITAVERTVAGEVAQGRGCGRILPEEEYRAIIRGKSGELFGAAAVLAALRSQADPVQARDVGCAVGALYQMVDDFLDYCPSASTGKEPFQDYNQRKFTFVLAEAGVEDFSLSPESVRSLLLAPGSDGRSAMDRALVRLTATRDAIVEACREVFGHAEGLSEILDGWIAAAAAGLRAETASLVAAVATPSAESEVARAARAIGGPEAWTGYFGRHSKSFRFASLLFPAVARTEVEGVYAFCRFTDDLVDEAAVPPAEARERLEAWRGLARAAYDGQRTGVPLLDTVMGSMRTRSVPFHYVDDLLTGVGMDIEPSPFPTLAALEVYTYRVAGVVGGWVTELFGLHDPSLLARAYALGHAMQLTNILRDVGEDWRNGRLYLPAEAMARFGVTPEDVARVAGSGGVDQRWSALMEHLMGVADRHYASAFEAIPALPGFYRRPVAVAARVYQGIHDEIRRNGYDNGTRRAHTTLGRKVLLGFSGLRTARRMGSGATGAGGLTLLPQDS